MTAGPRASYLIGRLDRIVRRRLNRALQEHGLTLSEYTALSVVRGRKGLSNAQLARRTMITPQSMNEVLAALSGRGLIRRTADPAHGRIIRTELTKAGTRALTSCDRAVDALEADMLCTLDAPARSLLLETLAGCAQRLEAA